MLTTLARVLARRGEREYVFAERMGMRIHTIYRLCGRKPPTGPSLRVAMHFNSATLEIISADTGVPIGVLVEDAIAAIREYDAGTVEAEHAACMAAVEKLENRHGKRKKAESAERGDRGRGGEG